ncbi:transcription elongation factor GreA [Furfurilactobacillus curtus]|uniref:Transcription elongation factor GreA n=2 Tax=Furfurilactobacillus curtus TaxID=1746200 RepID=A0ABQ5JPM5_9LACO
MELNENAMTPASYHQIQADIDALTADRPRRIKRLADAAALGDRSENAEYSAAKRDLRWLESRLHYLNKLQQYAEVITPQTTDHVELGRTFTVMFDADPTNTATYELVGKFEANLDEGKVSFDSPLGRAVLDRSVGATQTVAAPNGNYQVTITNLAL